MKVLQALNLVRQYGSIEVFGGNLKVRFPESARAALQGAVDVLRSDKAEALTLLTNESFVPPNQATPRPADGGAGVRDGSRIKGRAVELWRAGERFFVVADEEDARLAMDWLHAKRGEVWTAAEVELVARLEDQATRDLVERFKRELDGRVTTAQPEARNGGKAS